MGHKQAAARSLATGLFTALITLVFSAALMVAPLSTAWAADASQRVFDGASLLTSAQQAQLTSEMAQVTQEYGFDMAIVTTNSLNGETPSQYNMDFYTSHNLGVGSDKAGVIFLVSMGTHDWEFTVNASANNVFNSYGQEAVGGAVRAKLKSGDYDGAFETLVQMAGQFGAAAQAGNPYSSSHTYTAPKAPLTAGTVLLRVGISLVAGAVVALIVCFVLKAQLKSVKPARDARDYVKKDSFNITQSQDIFLFSTMAVVPKPKDTGSGGNGGFTHTSSGSFTSTGGKF
jgi:uncharacterized protein